MEQKYTQGSIDQFDILLLKTKTKNKKPVRLIQARAERLLREQKPVKGAGGLSSSWEAPRKASSALRAEADARPVR